MGCVSSARTDNTDEDAKSESTQIDTLIEDQEKLKREADLLRQAVAYKNENLQELVELRMDCLRSHNKYRAMHGVPKLHLNKDLCEMAQKYAEKLAATDSKGHSSKEDREYNGMKVGENLAYRGSTDKNAQFTGDLMVSQWYDEVENYDFSNPGIEKGTGHFTQVVWRDSVELGIGFVRYEVDGKMKGTLVGRYLPPGNFAGEFEENVSRSALSERPDGTSV